MPPVSGLRIPRAIRRMLCWVRGVPRGDPAPATMSLTHVPACMFASRGSRRRIFLGAALASCAARHRARPAWTLGAPLGLQARRLGPWNHQSVGPGTGCHRLESLCHQPLVGLRGKAGKRVAPPGVRSVPFAALPASRVGVAASLLVSGGGRRPATRSLTSLGRGMGTSHLQRTEDRTHLRGIVVVARPERRPECTVHRLESLCHRSLG